MAPILPGITDDPSLLRRTAAAAMDAGATHVYPILLHLRPRVKEEFMAWLESEHPGMVSRYEAIYRDRAYAPRAERQKLAGAIEAVLADLPGPRPTVARFAARRWQGVVDKAPQTVAEQLALV